MEAGPASAGPTTALMAAPVDIDCSALLPEGRALVVKELLPPCSAFYYVQPADTCSSVAQFLDITKESLQQHNPGVTCPSRLLAFRSLCVERDPAKGIPRCENVIETGSTVEFKQVAASHGLTMVDLCRIKPSMAFRDALTAPQAHVSKTNGAPVRSQGGITLTIVAVAFQ
ncbi:unnamed protein product [Closterium sp. Naga37s-1]|nr:unnamed protein product [Closterium sp. Naga37s-1]